MANNGFWDYYFHNFLTNFTINYLKLILCKFLYSLFIPQNPLLSRFIFNYFTTSRLRFLSESSFTKNFFKPLLSSFCSILYPQSSHQIGPVIHLYWPTLLLPHFGHLHFIYFSLFLFHFLILKYNEINVHTIMGLKI